MVSAPRGFVVFAHRDFRRWWAARLVSDTGTWVQITTLAGLVVARGQPPVVAAAITLANFFPSAVAGPLGGRAVDRWSARRVARIVAVVQVAVCGVLAAALFSGHTSIGVMLTLVGVQGVLGGALTPALRVLMVRSVPHEDLSAATGAASAVWDAGRVLGPLLAAGLALLVGSDAGWAALVNLGSFVVLIVLLESLQLQPASEPPGVPADTAHPDCAPGQPSPAAGNRDGGVWAVVRRTAEVRHALVGAVRWHALVVPFMGLIAVLAATLTTQAAGMGRIVTVTGTLMAAQGCGAVIAAAAVTGWWYRYSERARAQGAGLVAGAALLALGQAPTVPLAAVCLIVLAAATKVGTSAWQSVLYRSTPEPWRGEVFGLDVMAVNVTYGLAVMGQAALVGVVGLGAVFTATGVTIAVAEVVVTRGRRVRLRPRSGRLGQELPGRAA